MGDYADAAEFYDLLYADEKDYAGEAKLLEGLILEANPDATRLLDVGCGTGAHARSLLDIGFEVDGVDIEPAFVKIARAKCPEGSFRVGDMTVLDLPGRYDAVLCLFSAIGYARDLTSLGKAIEGMSGHLMEGGVLIVDPWFEPGQMDHGWIMAVVGKGDDVTVCRMSRTVVTGSTSRLEFEYLIGTSNGLERRSEVHELGLFTQEQMESAFRLAGLRVERQEKALRTRGLYVARRA